MDFIGEHASTIIALCAFIFTVWQFRQQRVHERLKNRPQIDSFSYDHKENKKGMIVFQIQNNGLGPAIIQSFKTYLDGKEYPVNEAVERLLKDIRKEQTKKTVGKLGPGSGFGVGHRLNLLELEFPCDTDQDMQEWRDAVDRLDVVITYQSIFEEERTLSTISENAHVHIQQP